MNTETKLADLQGQIIGLQAIVTAILSANPTLKLEEGVIGKLIMQLPVTVNEDLEVEIRSKARAVMHAVSGRRNNPTGH